MTGGYSRGSGAEHLDDARPRLATARSGRCAVEHGTVPLKAVGRDTDRITIPRDCGACAMGHLAGAASIDRIRPCRPHGRHGRSRLQDVRFRQPVHARRHRFVPQPPGLLEGSGRSGVQAGHDRGDLDDAEKLFSPPMYLELLYTEMDMRQHAALIQSDTWLALWRLSDDIVALLERTAWQRSSIVWCRMEAAELAATGTEGKNVVFYAPTDSILRRRRSNSRHRSQTARRLRSATAGSSGASNWSLSRWPSSFATSSAGQ